MTVVVASASESTQPGTVPEQQEEDILYVIGRALLAHKDRFYVCHRTGFTAELAWPLMQSILHNIRPYLKSSSETDTDSLKVLPLEPTPEMVRAALRVSIRVQEQYGDDIQPDSPGDGPSAMVRAVWAAMLQAAVCSQPPPEVRVSETGANVAQPLAVLSRAGQMLKSGTHCVLSLTSKAASEATRIVHLERRPERPMSPATPR